MKKPVSWLLKGNVFMILCGLKNRYIAILFSLIITMNILNLAYNRYKIYSSEEVVLKLKYELDPTTFTTDKPHPPSLFYDEVNNRTIIVSPAFPWYVNE